MATPDFDLEDEVFPKAMDEQLSSEDTKDISTQAWEAREKWYYIGICLEIPVSKLDVIKNDANDTDAQFSAMIKSWLERDENCIWKAMYNALKHDIVGKKSVANKLKEWLSSKGKHKATTQLEAGPSKKICFGESVNVRDGPNAPTQWLCDSTTSGDCMYFASDCKIFAFNMTSNSWTRSIKCPKKNFGLATINDELVAIGGVVDEKEVKDVTSFSLNKEKAKWDKDSYPPLKNERKSPNVVVHETYLVVLGGFVCIDSTPIPVASVEILDTTEKKDWWIVELPKELDGIKWLSSCICNGNIYIAAKHDDPTYKESSIKILKNDKIYLGEDDSDDEYEAEENFDTCDGVYLPGPHPCFSIFFGNLKTLIKVSEDHEVATENEDETKIIWQKLNHPHHSVYKNPRKDIPGAYIDESDAIVWAACLGYEACKFSLASVNNKLIAVGCQHIQSTPHDVLQPELNAAYESYYYQLRMIMEEAQDEPTVYTTMALDIIDYECHIYGYNTDSGSWDLIKSTPKNGSSAHMPTVAIIGNKMVIIRGSEIVHIVTFPETS